MPYSTTLYFFSVQKRFVNYLLKAYDCRFVDARTESQEFLRILLSQINIIYDPSDITNEEMKHRIFVWYVQCMHTNAVCFCPGKNR